jgi:DNA repair exonuclease SbcCD ATPase subunit
MPTELAAKFLIGCGGAAFTIYSNIGGELPGMGKSTEIRNLTESIDELKAKVKEAEEKLRAEQDRLSKGEISVEQFEAMERSINNSRDDWNAEVLDLRRTRDALRRGTYFQGALIFVALGGFFAMFLTAGALLENGTPQVQTILSAVVVGAGWSGIISRYIQTGELKDEALERNKKLDDIMGNYEGIIKENLAEYKEKLDAVNKERASIVDGYEKVVAMLTERVEEGRELAEKFNKIKEEFKDTKIAEDLARIGIEL